MVLVAHGTRHPGGGVVVEEIARLVRERGGVDVRVAYADVRQPDVTAVLREVRGPAVVVPAFLAAGYHVRVDVPAQVVASGHRDVVIAEPIGAAVVPAVVERLREAGWREGDPVVLGAAGSSDARALGEVRKVAEVLAQWVGGPVRVGYAATASPRIGEVVAEVRAAGVAGAAAAGAAGAAGGGSGGRVAVASWLLAPGVFHRGMRECGAEIVSEPIGAHERVVEAVLLRYYEGRRSRCAA
ncbi:sirohydrochlorin chelatase [Actinosynnema pretiosum subsp. pretiosum]|uniref:Sirohydrochlorin chelatase n=1 Tax=Actinosynnema pretiosum subsp. pretiosum TaxID=103721 RepID=A0AA45LCS0_9PSEU|nr:sirohydrochlorin chelatase [Actinosynnema pretiosum subsp. pretiosum]